MADFSVDLAAPQGAGTSPVAPVQPADTTGMILSGVNKVVDIFAKGVEVDSKQKALERKNAIVGSYVRAETVINQAAATGGMTPAEASARSRANFNQYIANNPDLITDLTTAAQSLRGFTEKGKIEDEVKSQQALEKANDDFARSRGFLITPDTGATAKNAIHEAAFAGKRAEERLAAFYKEQEYMRSKVNFDQAQSDREEKRVSFELVNDIASKNIVSFHEFNLDLRSRVASGSLTPQSAREQLALQFANIEGALTAAARLNPSLAAPYRTLFESLRQAGEKAVDPATAAADYEDMFKQVMAKAKLAAVSSDPKILAIGALSSIFGANAQIALNASAGASEAIARFIASGGNNTPQTPQVIGTDAEADVYKTLNGLIGSVKTAKGIDKEKAFTEAGAAYNTILQQVGEAPGRSGIAATDLGKVVNAISAPEFAELVSKGVVKPENLLRAKEALQVLYEPSVKRSMLSSLSAAIQNRSPFDMSIDPFNLTGRQGKSMKPLNETVELQFNGSGVSVVPKGGMSLDPIERRNQTNMIAAMKPILQSFNTVLHASAHLKGGTNYEKEWKDSRHEYFPEFFTKPKDSTSVADQIAAEAEKEKPKRSAREEKMAEQVADLPKPTDAEMAEYRKILIKALERTDLSTSARAEIEADLARNP